MDSLPKSKAIFYWLADPLDRRVHVELIDNIKALALEKLHWGVEEGVKPAGMGVVPFIASHHPDPCIFVINWDTYVQDLAFFLRTPGCLVILGFGATAGVDKLVVIRKKPDVWFMGHQTTEVVFHEL